MHMYDKEYMYIVVTWRFGLCLHQLVTFDFQTGFFREAVGNSDKVIIFFNFHNTLTARYKTGNQKVTL